jgi:hypothetical protein
MDRRGTRALGRTPTWDATPPTLGRDFLESAAQPLWYGPRKAPSAAWQPVPDHYAVGFRVMHGFGSATAVYDVSKTTRVVS